MKRLRIIVGSAFLLFFVFLMIYDGDNEYLQEKTADKIWFEFTETVNDIVRKGDHISYAPSPVNTETNKWKRYRDRLAYQIEVLNIKNAPMMKNSYLLETKFEDFEGKYNVYFTLYEKNTGKIVDAREITSEPIKAKSTIPAILAVVFAIITLRPILSLLVAVWVGSIINNANSPIVGLQQMIANYIPAGLIGKDFSNLKIIISFMLIQASLALLVYSACAKNLKDINSKFLKILPIPFMAVHPYIFASIGSWWFNLFTTKPKQMFRSSFISQSLSLALPALFFSPYILYIFGMLSHQLYALNLNISPIDLFARTLPFRFFSFSIIAVIIGYSIFNKNIGEISTDVVSSDTSSDKFKPMMKINRWLPYFAIFAAIAVLSIGSFFFDDINTSLLVSAAICFTTVSSILLKTYLLSFKEIGKVSWLSLRSTINYTVLLVLSFALIKVLYDLGTVYYIISLFKVKIGSTIFPLTAFIMSVLTTLIMGNSFVTFTLLTPLLLPIAGQLGGITELTMTIAGILEGGLAGEMISPFSPSSIITSSIYKISTARHIITQLPYVSMCLACAGILGFLMCATDIPIWISYCAILAFGLIVMIKRPTYKIMS
ncbi:MAG: Na+/H+ antiporter NhaC family protein [bacterium]